MLSLGDTAAKVFDEVTIIGGIVNYKIEKLVDCFKLVLELDDSELVVNSAYQETESWDSLAHMALVAEIEREFQISLEMDDVIDLSTFNEAKRILSKYEIKFDS